MVDSAQIPEWSLKLTHKSTHINQPALIAANNMDSLRLINRSVQAGESRGIFFSSAVKKKKIQKT